jgi:hypothetical protein
LIVPLEGINHVADLVKLRRVNFSHEHITVTVNEAHFALSSSFNLIQLHLDDVSCVFNRRLSLSRVDFENAHDLRVARINESDDIGSKRNVSLT